MARHTQFAGLTALDPAEPLTDDGGGFTSRNPDVIDRLLHVGGVTHRHDAHPALGNPTDDPIVTILPTGGTIPAGLEIFVGYTLFDADGGETTLNTNVQRVTTGGGLSAPTDPPDAVGDYAGGTLLAATYVYAVSVTDAAGGETTLSPIAQVTLDPGFSSGEVGISGLDSLVAEAGGSQWRLWRSINGGAWYLLNQGGTDTYLDDGSVGGDCTISPPDSNTTAATNQLEVLVPVLPSGAAQFAIYASPDEDFISPALLGVYPSSAAGSGIVYPALNPLDGSPPPVSLAWPGARQINPDTDLLDWHWKRPVTTRTALPAGVQGDVRLTLDSGHLWAVLGATAADYHGWSDTDPGGGGGSGGVSIKTAQVTVDMNLGSAHVGSGATIDWDEIGISIDGAVNQILLPQAKLYLIETTWYADSTAGLTGQPPPSSGTVPSLSLITQVYSVSSGFGLNHEAFDSCLLGFIPSAGVDPSIMPMIGRNSSDLFDPNLTTLMIAPCEGDLASAGSDPAHYTGVYAALPPPDLFMGFLNLAFDGQPADVRKYINSYIVGITAIV